jgi:succinate dehydrogenase / fumarate reductase cytochrome b subunit
VTSTTAPANIVPLLGGHRQFLLRRLHSLTGIIFGLYICVHLLVNATLVQGGNIFQLQVDKIHSLPFLWGVEWLLIYIPIIYHTVYGAWIILTGQPNNGSYPYFKNTFYLLQRISAIILAAFIFYHVLSMHGLFGSAFIPTDATRSVRANIGAHFVVVYLVYPIGIIAACFHTANGFWTSGISWGLTVSKGGQQRWGWVCLLVFIFMTAAGMIALGAAAFGGPRA